MTAARAGERRPAVGSYVRDGRDGRVGEVMGFEGGHVRLRPPGGGRSWDCPPAEVGAAEPGEVLRARVREANRRKWVP
ncbi:hypothetical protein GCM10018793_55460 [Streptomyces sulfonofaciens]|uniref:Uncharacterized protein n=1 Tax=Streptomyces sulfonofaciens TaxID=68272 RepID=A0A919GJR2_9ACTN|nr:hypothetical protein [Streptomyces sulfonofaciens]GHH85864.1 hypothetical protein GCM10018793_55460 [Streptomyces sulfonofaciens]